LVFLIISVPLPKGVKEKLVHLINSKGLAKNTNIVLFFIGLMLICFLYNFYYSSQYQEAYRKSRSQHNHLEDEHTKILKTDIFIYQRFNYLYGGILMMCWFLFIYLRREQNYYAKKLDHETKSKVSSSSAKETKKN